MASRDVATAWSMAQPTSQSVLVRPGGGRGVCGVGRCDPEVERLDYVLHLRLCDGSDRGIPAG